MFSKRLARHVVPVEYRMMMHAFVASWGSIDPYYQNGAALTTKDSLITTAHSSLTCDTTFLHNLTWDDPGVYSYVVPAELRVFYNVDLDKMYDLAIYITSVPHPSSVKLMVDQGVKKIVYYPHRMPTTPRYYKKEFAKLASAHFSLKIEPYTGKLHWLRDKLDIMEKEIPDLFS